MFHAEAGCLPEHHCIVDATLQNPFSELYSPHVIHTTAEKGSVANDNKIRLTVNLSSGQI